MIKEHKCRSEGCKNNAKYRLRITDVHSKTRDRYFCKEHYENVVIPLMHGGVFLTTK